jgi:hypothetical protein
MLIKYLKYSILFVSIIISYSALYAQTPDTIWTQTYGGIDHDVGFAVMQTPYDLGYIITGYTTSYGAGGRDVYIIKTDENGDTLWTQTIGYIYDETGYSLAQTADTGYIISGNWYNNPLANLKLWKVDMNGSLSWTKTYDLADRDYGQEIQRTLDNGYIIVGAIYDQGYGSTILVKTDSNGDTTWIQEYPFCMEGRSVKQTSDRGYILTGDIIAGAYFDIILVRTDSLGDTLWTKSYGGGFWDKGYAVCITDDHGFIITGQWGMSSNNNDICIIKTDSSGIADWIRVYGGPSWDCGHAVQQTSDGGYIVAGYRYASGNQADLWLIKTDAIGDTLWTRIYGGLADDEAFSLQLTSDNGYVIAGCTASFGEGANDVWLLKMEPDTFSISEQDFYLEVYDKISIYPNPFVNKTEICLPSINTGNIQIMIFNSAGELVRNIFPPDGKASNTYRVIWDGKNNNGNTLPCGIYFLVYKHNGYIEKKKIILIK